jgi:CheY-like chemotaxis protein
MCRKRRSVLLVDDDEDIRNLVTLLLGDAGYEVRTAADGLAASEALSDWRPDVILLDLMMPVMDGRAFLAHRRTAPELLGIPVIVMTASRNSEGDAEESGVAATVAKPFDIRSLLAAVSAHTASGRPMTVPA